jgi:hypothetical protein
MSEFDVTRLMDRRFYWLDDVGDQLGQAVGSQIDDLAGAVYDYAKHDSLRHMTEGEVLDMMLSLHMELVREDQ